MRSRIRGPRRTILSSLFAALLVLFATTPALAAEQPVADNEQSVADNGGLRVELNKLEPIDSACRAYLMFENHTDVNFTSLKLDLVMFDPQGIINRRLAVEGGPLPASKTSVKLFDIEGVSCSDVDRVLLNGILNCTSAQGERSDCLGLVETTSRNSTDFFK